MARDRARSVFVNCPFDSDYKPLFDAIVFTATYCRFEARSALEVSDAGEFRLAKIIRLIAESRFSIHDISRIELDSESGLPRFNMPIELGIAIGAKHLGGRSIKDHLLLVLDSERYRYQMFASDLAGIDIEPHGGKVDGAIAAVRGFLAPHSPSPLPGAGTIRSAFDAFEATLPIIAAAAKLSRSEITYVDRLRFIASYIDELP